MPSPLYFAYMHRAFEHHLTRCPVRLAYPESHEVGGEVRSGNPNHIIGVLVADPTSIGLVVHYLGTRRDFDPEIGEPSRCYRRQGIARTLVDSMFTDYGKGEDAVPRHMHYTVRTPMFYRNPAFQKWVDHDMKGQITYNQFLFERFLPPQWETGLQVHADPEMVQRSSQENPFG